MVALAGLGPRPLLAAPASGEAVEGPVADPPASAEPPLPSVEDEPGEDPLPSVEDEPGERPAEPGEVEPEAPAEPGEVEPEAPAEPGEAKPEPPPPSMQEPEQIRVAVGLSSELDGSKQERALLDQLERSVAASPSPRADVRRLRVGAAAPKQICREGRDDLVITIAYVPDRNEPMLLSYDCRIDAELGIRRGVAAEDPELLGVLWSEHRDRVAKGAHERRRTRISPKLRTGLIAGAAVTVIGVAVGLLIAGAVQRDTVVLVVSP